jgi:hypothetical protein
MEDPRGSDEGGEDVITREVSAILEDWESGNANSPLRLLDQEESHFDRSDTRPDGHTLKGVSVWPRSVRQSVGSDLIRTDRPAGVLKAIAGQTNEA